MNQIETLATYSESQLLDQPRTDNRRQISAVLILDHKTEITRLEPVATVDFYRATQTQPTRRTT